MRSLGKPFDPIKRPNKDQKVEIAAQLKKLHNEVQTYQRETVDPIMKEMRFQELNLLHRALENYQAKFKECRGGEEGSIDLEADVIYPRFQSAIEESMAVMEADGILKKLNPYCS